MSQTTYTNISNLPTLSTTAGKNWVPVENVDGDSKSGAKVDLDSVTPGSLDTTSTSSQEASADEPLTGNIKLHKVAKTGSYNDLLDKPDIPTVGTLNTSNTTAQTVNESESLTGAVNLHKVAKTGSYDDLLNKPSIPTLGYTRVSQQVSAQHHDTGTCNYTYTINVNNREAITATLTKISSSYSKGIILELSDDCDDAIICINANGNADVDYGLCRRGSNSLIKIFPVTPTILNYSSGDILASNNYDGCDYELPTDWSDVKLLDSNANIATFDNNYGYISGLKLKQFVVRIIADCAFYYPVEWGKAD